MWAEVCLHVSVIENGDLCHGDDHHILFFFVIVGIIIVVIIIIIIIIMPRPCPGIIIVVIIIMDAWPYLQCIVIGNRLVRR